MSFDPFNIGSVPVGGPVPFFILGPCALESEAFAWEMARSLKEIADRTPGSLNQSYFTNSGTEADEMAILLAKIHTGRQEIIALRHSYSGRGMYAVSAMP